MAGTLKVDRKLIFQKGAQMIMRAQNKYGYEVRPGDVVCLDTTNSTPTNLCFTVSNTIDDVAVLGMSLQVIANGEYGDILVAGPTDLLLADGNTDIAAGNQLSVIDGATYADYTTGTISVNSGAAAVTGSGTTWTAAMKGRTIRFGSETTTYRITAVGGATSLTIGALYRGASNLSGSSYVITAKGRAAKATAGKGGAFAVALEAYTTNDSFGVLNAWLFGAPRVDSAAAGTLDQAYDYGGAGSGKAITVDSGAVALTNNAANNNGVLTLEKTPAGAQSGALATLTLGANATGAALVFANSGSGNDITGSGTWSVTKAGVAVFGDSTLGAATLSESTKPAGTIVYICRDNTGDLNLNALTGKQIELKVAGTDVITIAGAAITLAQATTVSAGGLTVATGGLTVSAGGAAVTGNSTITGTLTVTGAMTWGGQVTFNAGIDVNGTEMILDVNGDTSITADTDNQIDFKIGGTDYVSITTTVLDINALELVLDANADTSITADTDNRIDFKLGGTDELRYSTGAFAFQVATTISTAATTLTLSPTTDVVVANGKGLIVGNAAQVTTTQANELQVLGTAAADSTLTLGHWAAAATGPGLDFVKSRNATIGTSTIVTAADTLGTITWFGDDGADFATPAASIKAEADDLGAAAPGLNDMPGRLVFSTTADGGAAVTEAMRIDRSQDVHINNASGLVIGSPTVQYTVGGAVAELQVLGTAAADSMAVLAVFVNDATGPIFGFAKSRAGAIDGSTFAIVNNADTLGTIAWHVDDGADFVSVAASIRAVVNAAPGANDTPGALVFATTADGAQVVTDRMVIDHLGGVFIGDTTNANGVICLTINQAGNDDQILCFKSSDVATVLTTAVTNSVETDDFATFSKFAAATGGLMVQALGENAAVTTNLLIESYGGQASATHSTAGRALIEVYASQHDGANALSNVTNDGNVFGVRCRTGGADSTLALVDEDGDLWLAGTVTTVGAGVIGGTLTIGGTIYGGSAANGDLILASTSHATEGCVSIPDGTMGLILGGVEANAWATADNYIYLKNATVAPAGAPGTAGAGLYAAGGELYGIDNLGNTLLNSAHTPDGDAVLWSYGAKTGKTVRIHLEKLLRKLIQKFPEFANLIEEADGKKHNCDM